MQWDTKIFFFLFGMILMLPSCFKLSTPMDRPDGGTSNSDNVLAIDTHTIDIHTDVEQYVETDEQVKPSTLHNQIESETATIETESNAISSETVSLTIRTDTSIAISSETYTGSSTDTFEDSASHSEGRDTDTETLSDEHTESVFVASDTITASVSSDTVYRGTSTTISYLEIVSAYPDNSNNVGTQSHVEVTFSEDISESSVTSASFLVTSGNTSVSGSVSVEGARVIFIPDLQFSIAKTYEVTVTDEIESLSGSRLASPSVSWSFTTIDGTWSTPELLDDGNGDALEPQIAMDPTGNAIAVWSQKDDAFFHIWASRFKVGEGWKEPEKVESNDAGDALHPQVDVDNLGNAIVVWDQSESSITSIWANRFSVDSGWGTPTLLEEEDDGNALNPQVAVEADGNAVAVWSQSGSNYTLRTVYANRYVMGLGWAQASPAEGSSGYSSDQQVIIDPNANAMVVWNSRGALWGNWFVPGTGWFTEVVLDPYGGGAADSPKGAVDAVGNVMVVWTDGRILSSLFELGVGWGDAVLVTADDIDDAAYPQIDATPDGFSLLIWQQSDGAYPSIWSSSRNQGGSWSSAALLEEDNAGPASDPQIAVDPGGNAVATWSQHDGSEENILINRFIQQDGWKTAPQSIESRTGNSQYPQVAVDTFGNSIVIWQQDDGNRTSIWASYFSEN